MSAGLTAWLARRSYLVVLALLLLGLFAYARTHRLADAIRRAYIASGMTRIDLPAAVPHAWQRVCVLGPYSSSKDAAALLGFAWNADAHSDIRSDDTITLLVFVKDGEVVAAADYPHADGDLSSLASHCYPRAQAIFAPHNRTTQPIIQE